MAVNNKEVKELFQNKMKFPGILREFEPKRDIDYAIEFTKVYKSENDKYLREIKCLEMQIPYVMSEIQEDEIVVGLCLHGFVGFSPQWGGSYTYYFHGEKMLETLKLIKNDISTDYYNEAMEVINFWNEENTAAKHIKAFKEMFPESHIKTNYQDIGTANADVRLAGTCVDLDKLLSLGVNGLKEDLRSNKSNFDNKNLYEAMERSIDTITLGCDIYIKKIKAIKNKKRKNELKITLEALENIRTNKPETFFQGIQLIWIYSMISDLLNYGRLDICLGDLYVRDIENGITNEEQSINHIISMYRQMRKIGKKHDSRIIIGGKGRRNEENADKVALLFMEASRRYKEIVPQLTFRYYNGCNDIVYNKALKVNSEGCTFPIIYSDETNIPAVMKVYDVSYEEACNYMPFGCGEYVLEALSLGTPNNGVNTLKALELALHEGYDFVFDGKAGFDTKKLEDIKNFEDLFIQFENQLKPYIKWLAYHKSLNYEIAAKECGYLHISILMNDCFKKGKPILEGGVRYKNAASEVFGIVSAADSLTAIKKLVFDEKKLTLKEIVNILDNDFEGYDIQRKMMINAPKYGNDDDYADEIAKKVFDFVANETIKNGKEVGLNKYNIVSVNNSMSAEWGYYCLASACGRKRGSAMSNGNGASIGADKKGITSLLNSMAKIDTSKHVGVIHNIRFSKEMFTNDFDKVKMLLTSFYNNNGVQTNIACVGKDDLENAIKKPEKYQNLIVRIGGFSERFVELNSITQQEIINRTTY